MFVWYLIFQLIQLMYFIIAPMADVLTLLKGREDNWLVKLRDLMFASFAFPICVVSNRSCYLSQPLQIIPINPIFIC